MLIRIVLIFALCAVSSCAGGTRGTGATIDRKFTDSPGTGWGNNQRLFDEPEFEEDCDPYEEDCS